MIWALPLILMALLVAAILAKSLKMPLPASMGLSIWHTVFCLLYYVYSLTNTADSTLYYSKSLLSQFEWKFGTSAVIAFTSLFTAGLGMNYLSSFFLYNIFGVAGVIVLFHCLLTVWPNGKHGALVPYLLVFLPTLQFWSSAIGKDAPAFLAACLMCFASLNLNRRKAAAAAAILLMFTVRPHIAAIMLVSLGFSLVTSRDGVSGVQRIVLIFLGSCAAALLLPFALKYAGLSGEISVEYLTESIEKRQGYNMSGGSSVNIASMPIYTQFFTYLFRPLFFDAQGVMGLVVSTENAIFLTISLLYLPRSIILAIQRSSVALRFNLIYSVFCLLVLATTTANLGIAIRQKTMVLPSIFVLMALGAASASAKKDRLRRYGANYNFWPSSISAETRR